MYEMAPFEVVGDEIMGEEIMGAYGMNPYMGHPMMGAMMHPAYGGGMMHPYGGGYSHPNMGRGMYQQRGRSMQLPPKPGWRSQLAPGVIQPDEGLLPLALTGTGGNNTFSATVNQIIFQGSLQKPFRGERVLVTTVRTGTSSTGRLLTLPFVGTDLQLADVTPIDIEQLGSPQSFGTRLTMHAAEPGVLFRMSIALSTALAGTDTIAAQITVLGRVIH